MSIEKEEKENKEDDFIERSQQKNKQTNLKQIKENLESKGTENVKSIISGVFFENSYVSSQNTPQAQS